MADDSSKPPSGRRKLDPIRQTATGKLSRPFPDGDSRGIDSVADWDKMGLIDDEPVQTGDGGNDAVQNAWDQAIWDQATWANNADPPVEPGPQKVAHDNMVRDIEALQAEVEKLKLTVKPQMGHNNPPSAIDEGPEISGAQIVEIVTYYDSHCLWSQFIRLWQQVSKGF